MTLIRSAARVAGVALIVLGLSVFAWIGWTLEYGDPVTGYIAGRAQTRLLAQWHHTYASTPISQAAPSCARSARRYHPAVAAPYAILTIPKLNLHNVAVVQGTADVLSQLDAGPGHYTQTSNPCEGRTVAIAGHRTTWGAWFFHIDSLARGDRITLTMPYGRFLYVVTGHAVVSPTAWWIINNHGYDRLVLSACNPRYSAAQRWVVFARLVSKPRRSGGGGA